VLVTARWSSPVLCATGQRAAQMTARSGGSRFSGKIDVCSALPLSRKQDFVSAEVRRVEPAAWHCAWEECPGSLWLPEQQAEDDVRVPYV